MEKGWGSWRGVKKFNRFSLAKKDKAKLFLVSNFNCHRLHGFLTGQSLSCPTAKAEPNLETCQKIMKMTFDVVTYLPGISLVLNPILDSKMSFMECALDSQNIFEWIKCARHMKKKCLFKGHLNSEWIYEVIVSPKMQTKNHKDFCPTNKDHSTFFWWFFGYDPCLLGRAEILVILGLHFGRNDDLINSFWI